MGNVLQDGTRSVRLKIVKVLKNKVILRVTDQRETWKTRPLDCILERKKDISGKSDDVQRKSKV